jgi:hypothetical protein
MRRQTVITSTAINLKDIGDIKWRKQLERPEGYAMRLNRSALRRRMDEENLINFVARKHGYTECPNAAAPGFAYVKEAGYKFEGKRTIQVRFTNDCVVGYYKLVNGKVYGIVQAGDTDMFGNEALTEPLKNVD